MRFRCSFAARPDAGADALAQGADTLITCGAPQSNHCRITLAAAVKEGLKCRFVIEERVPNSYDPKASGNNFMFRLLGVCCVVESNTYGSAFYRAAGIPGSGHEAGWVKVAPSGAVDVSVGLMASGQGYETALAQAAAEGLGVSPDVVRLHLGNTDIAPTEEADIHIAGSGHVNLHTNPKKLETHIAGSGRIHNIPAGG